MAVYFIDNNTGNDTNAGTSSLPWATLSKFQTTAVDGDTAVLVPSATPYQTVATFRTNCTLMATSGVGTVKLENSSAGNDAIRIEGCVVNLYWITPQGASNSGQSAYSVSSGGVRIFNGGSVSTCDRAVTLRAAGSFIYAENTAFSGKPWVTVPGVKGELKRCTSVAYLTNDLKGISGGSPAAHWHSYMEGLAAGPQFFAAEEFHAEGSGVAFVDSISGDDNNWFYCSESKPVKNIRAALGIPGVGTIYIKNPGAGTPIKLASALNIIGRNIRIVGEISGIYDKVILDGSDTRSDWVLESGSVYRRTMSNNGVIRDPSSLDDEGNPKPLVEVGSVAACQSLAGSYYYNSGTGIMYVNTYNGASPNNSLRIPFAGNVIQQNGGNLELTNVKITGAYNEGLLSRVGAKVRAYACNFSGNSSNGAEVTNGSYGYFERCDFLSNGIINSIGDGIGCHNQSKVELVNCKMRLNEDDGASPHNECTMIISGSLISDNKDRGFVGVQRSIMEIRESTVTDNGNGTGTGQNISAEDGTRIYADTVSAYGQPVTAENVRVITGSVGTFRSVVDNDGNIIDPQVISSTVANDLADRDLIVVSAQNSAIIGL